ncbi:MAG: CvpA family protein [Omnitrophica bacterium]|nr:CvpA family protein [Candidatus Omnitrophota bacterium]
MNLSFLPVGNWVDVIVIIFLIRGGYIGLQRGFSIELFKVLGAVATCVLSLLYYGHLGKWLATSSFLSLQVANFLSFLILFFLLLLVFRTVRVLLFKVLHLELLGEIEKWGGLILGLGRSLVFASLFLFALTLLPFEYIKESVEQESFSGAELKEMGPRMLEFIVRFKPETEGE